MLPEASLLVRAVRRVRAHRHEAQAFFGYVVVVSLVVWMSGMAASLFDWLADDPQAGLPGAFALAMTTAWIPLMVIDMRRCTRETTLRRHVEADLDVHRRAERQALDAVVETQARISRVLIAGGPRMVYQPIVDMTTGRVLGLEALSRFDDGGCPAEWFASAADVGLGTDLELCAVRRALADLDALPGHAYLSLNVGPDTLGDPRLLATLGRAPRGRIVLELTEHCAVADYAVCRDAMRALRAHGVRLAVDDAGAGYASLRHVIDLAPDIIKVDRSLVQGIAADAARRSLFVALVTFAQDLGAALVAEGVETAAEAEQLTGWGVELAQGWHFGRPEPLHRVELATA